MSYECDLKVSLYSLRIKGQVLQKSCCYMFMFQKFPHSKHEKNQLLYLFGWTKLSNRSEKWFDCKFLFEPLTLTVGWISARLPSAPFSLYGTLVANLCWSPSRINSGDVSPSAHRGFVDCGPHLRLCCIGGSFVKPAYGYTCTCRLIYSSSLTI